MTNNNKRSLKTRLIAALAAAFLLCAGCSASPADDYASVPSVIVVGTAESTTESTTEPTTESTAEPTTESTTQEPTTESLSANDEKALDAFCDQWNAMMSEDAPDSRMALDPSQITFWPTSDELPQGTRVVQLKAGVSSITLYILDGKIIAADATTLTRDWRSGGNNYEAGAASQWDACWKTMVMCLNNNEEDIYSPGLLTAINSGMPRPSDIVTEKQGELVEDKGWEYRMASLERNAGVMYEKRVRACDMEYADDFETWMNWV